MLAESYISDILDAHRATWADNLSLDGKVRQILDIYNQEYWLTRVPPGAPVESPRAYELVESYAAGLHSISPKVEVTTGPTQDAPLPREKLEGISELASSWLRSQRAVLIDATRLALTTGYAGIKVLPGREVFSARAIVIPPWELIVDPVARDWEDQRWVMHAYWIPLDVARRNWPSVEWSTYGRNPDFTPLSIRLPNEPWVFVVEIYDLTDGEFAIYSPDVEKKWVHKASAMVLEANDGSPIAPIVQVKYGSHPEAPLVGISPISRTLSQLIEHLRIRSIQARAILKTQRLYLTKKGVLDEEAQIAIANARDGSIIEIDEGIAGSLSDAVVPLPQSPVPGDLQAYANAVENDIARGTVFAPFTRGEATRATATEVTALATYTSTEMGRMAADRDRAIEALSLRYLRMVADAMEGPTPVTTSTGVAVITPDDLNVDFTIRAADVGGTPLMAAAQKRELVELLPTLAQLGVPREQLLKELVHAYKLPDTLAEVAKTEPQPTNLTSPEEQ